MKHLVVLVLSLCTLVLSANSQTVKGKLVDPADNTPLAGATVMLTSVRDSLNTRNVVADSTGGFLFSGVSRDTFYLSVRSVGYESYKQVVSLNAAIPSADLGQVYVPKKSTELSTVVVESKVPPVSQKGDTIQFNASAFKTNPDATVEDLVKKAPGMTVARDGTVTAGGETVRKVTIDGKDFFGDDASAALRNLPADVVDKIQVFDRLSDQAQFTGVDDGNSQKSLNIVTKSGLKTGQFGRIYAGGGGPPELKSLGINSDARYSAGGNMSFFKGDRRLSFVGLANNINQQNFGSQDLLGVTSSGGGRGGGRPGGGFGGGSGNFQVGQQAGISRTNAIGVNYSDKWGKKLDVQGSYFFNNSNLNNDQQINQQTLADAGKDSTLFIDQNSRTATNNYNHRVNLRLTYNIDSNNTIIMTPSVNTQRNRSEFTSFQQNYYNLTDGILSQLSNNRNSISTGWNFNNNLLYRHAFSKRGRTISLNVNTSINDRDGWTYQETLPINNSQNDSVNNYTTNRTKGNTISTNLIYTEPVGKTGQLQFNYNPSFTKNSARKETYEYEVATKGYTNFDDSLSNNFDNNYNTQNGGVTYRVGGRDNSFSVNMNYQYSSLESEVIYPKPGQISQSFTNFLPGLQFRRKISPRSSVRIFYRTNVNSPNINSLQNVLDISNPLRVTTGNPDLDQQYQHTLATRYTFTNTQKGQSFFANVFVQKINDYVTSGVFTAAQDSVLTPSFTLGRGGQLTKPINLDGYYSIRSRLDYSQPLNFLKTNFNINGGVTYGRTPGQLNGINTITNVLNYQLGTVLASNISQYVDFNFSYGAEFSRARNDQQPSLNQNYTLLNGGLQFNLLSKTGWFLQNDLTNTTYKGLTNGFNTSYWLWNVGAGKKLLPGRRGEVKLSVFDLLKQNQAITRSVVDGLYIQDERNTVLQRYVMLTFTYNLKNFGTAKTQNQRGGGERNFGPPGGGGNQRPGGGGPGL